MYTNSFFKVCPSYGYENYEPAHYIKSLIAGLSDFGTTPLRIFWLVAAGQAADKIACLMEWGSVWRATND
jgi:hypothetical protein